VGWVCCWFSSLLRGFFSGFFGFRPSTKINISKFQFDREFEGHGFVSRLTVMCHPRKTKLIIIVDYYCYYIEVMFFYLKQRTLGLETLTCLKGTWSWLLNKGRLQKQARTLTLRCPEALSEGACGKEEFCITESTDHWVSEHWLQTLACFHAYYLHIFAKAYNGILS